MQRSVARLKRLHVLRSHLADAAVVAQQQIETKVGIEDRMLIALEAEKGSSPPLSGTGESWLERQARSQIAARLSASCVQRRDDLLQAAEVAALTARAAVQAREQMRVLAERLEMTNAREKARTDQGRLDDLFAIARLRKSMTTTL